MESGVCGAEPEKHLGLDLWLLLLLASLAGKRSEAVHKLLKKKFAEGLADSAWLDKAVCGHQVSVRHGSHRAGVSGFRCERKLQTESMQALAILMMCCTCPHFGL